jgi:putative membrane protein
MFAVCINYCKFAMIRSLTSQEIKWRLLLILHLVGLVGLSFSPSRPFFAQLSFFNLFITAALIFHEVWLSSRHPWRVLIWLFSLGMAVEILGVQTGFPFGEYSYGTVLGPRLAGVSVIIGLNWFYLVVSSVALLRWIGVVNVWQTMVSASLILAGVDFLIEPVAINLDYWQWEAVSVPLSNYIAWFVVSLPLVYLYQRFTPDPPVLFPAKVLLLQVVFFSVLQFFL